MTPHDKLMQALEAWEGAVTNMVIADSGDYAFDVEEAYREYKAAPKPLVLEQVEWDDVKEFERVYVSCDSGLVLSTKRNDQSWFPKGKCYRLPEAK